MRAFPHEPRPHGMPGTHGRELLPHRLVIDLNGLHGLRTLNGVQAWAPPHALPLGHALCKHHS
jgi:hypothetical protein